MKSPTRPTAFLLPVAGWKELVHLPGIGIGPIIAKLDTGARTAALHADDIKVKGKRVTFVLHDDGERVVHTATVIGRKRIKSSNGLSETRPVIETDIVLGAMHFRAEVTLTNRGDMGFAMLLGRATIRGRCLVNPACSFLFSRKSRRP